MQYSCVVRHVQEHIIYFLVFQKYVNIYMLVSVYLLVFQNVSSCGSLCSRAHDYFLFKKYE